MTIQKFLIPDGIEYYDNKQALLFENIRSSVLNIFKRYKYKLVIFSKIWVKMTLYIIKTQGMQRLQHPHS